jgi:N-acetyl-alpha-D-muramate 1-phosphate uridylyltransferase
MWGESRPRQTVMQTGEAKINPDLITAFIPAAGYGSRLGSLTQSRPKALAEVNGIPLLAHAIRKLRFLGISKFIVNVHHFAGMISDFLKSDEFAGLDVRISDESDALLDTGGGLIKASRLVDSDCQTILMHNVDILTDINLFQAISQHVSNSHDATLLVSDRNSGRKLIFDNNMKLRGWTSLITGEELMTDDTAIDAKNMMAFSGIHLVNPATISTLNDQTIPLTRLYLSLAGIYTIKGQICNPTYWFDLGKQGDLLAAERFLHQKQHRDE